MKRIRKWLLGVSLVVGVLALGVAWPKAELPNLKVPDLSKASAHDVVRVIDGDTIVCNLDGKDVTIRLIGVDTPETVHPSKPVEQYGKEASRFTTNLLKGEQDYLSGEGQTQEKDKYGRLLAYVYRAPDGLFVNAEIIRQGYGHAYTTFPFKYLGEFRQLEKFARGADKGLWAEELKEAEEPAVAPSRTPAVTKPQPQTEKVIVHITRTGKKYHRAGCRSLSKSDIPISLGDAVKRGYTPCSVCRPPTASRTEAQGIWAGFRGLKWGTNIAKVPGMTLVEDDGDEKFYQRRGDRPTIGEAKLKAVTYGFYKGRFSYLIIEAEGLLNWTALRDAVFATYGQGYQPNEYIEEWHWGAGVGRGSQNMWMILEYNEFSGAAKLGMGYYPIRRQQEADKAKKAKEAGKDF